METKRGVSLVILIISIMAIVIIGTVIVIQTDEVLYDVRSDEFAIELATIEDKIKEYYIMMGSLPILANQQYDVDALKVFHANLKFKEVLEKEIIENEDGENIFYVVDLNLLGIETEERGKQKDATDIFVVASNTLNVYYLKGLELKDKMYFSNANLVNENIIEDESVQESIKTSLNQEMSLIKSTNVWTNELNISINVNLKSSETIQYSIAGETKKDMSSNRLIILNSRNMTDEEKAAFETNKTLTVSRLENGIVTETKEISISNLDIITPSLGNLEMLDTSNTDTNIIKINSSDTGNSGIKEIYYDFNTILEDDVEKQYYSQRSEVNGKDLISFGKMSINGQISLDKNIKSIVAVAVDNANNISDVVTYTIEDTYLISK